MTLARFILFLFLLFSLNTRDLWSQFEEGPSESSEKVVSAAQKKKLYFVLGEYLPYASAFQKEKAFLYILLKKLSK